jgi:hypothetical protein
MHIHRDIHKACRMYNVNVRRAYVITVIVVKNLTQTYATDRYSFVYK